jgi:hypothetical protein
MASSGDVHRAYSKFVFEEGRIVELWDVGQPTPEQSPNQYGMF